MTSNPSSEPYTDTYILDCNRNNSVEADAGNNTNPAQFTNKQGKGLKLNRGDKVSLHSAMINEIGNTDGTIEFKGEIIKNSSGEAITYELYETEDTLTQLSPLDNLYSAGTNYPWDPDLNKVAIPQQIIELGNNVGNNNKQLLQPYGHHQCDTGQVKKVFEMKDNEMNVQVAYYKTTNGENYMHLPRRYDCGSSVEFAIQRDKQEKSAAGAGVDLSKVPAAPRLGARLIPAWDTLPYAYQGTQWSGAPPMISSAVNELGNFDSAWNGLPLSDVRVQSQVPEDWFFQDKGNTIKCENMSSLRDSSGTGITNRHLNTLGTQQRYRYRNDNSRFMMFKKERSHFTDAPLFSEFKTPTQKGASIAPGKLGGSTTNDFLCFNDDGSDGHQKNPDPTKFENFYWNVRDPACTSDWSPYYEIKNVSVESGFKAPEDVADEVSRKLNKTGKVEEIFARTGKVPAFGGGVNPGYKNAAANENQVDPSKIEIGASHQCVGFKKDGELFKSFYSTNHAHFGAQEATEYFINSATGVAAKYPEKLPAVINYMSAYHFIGVKRPDLWTSGRTFCRQALGVKTPEEEVNRTWGEVAEFSLHPDATPIASGNYETSDLITTIPWNQRHLLKDFIVSQGNYPELFDYPWSSIKLKGDFKTDADVSPSEFQMGNSKTGETLARFLHMDIIQSDDKIWKKKTGNVSFEYKSDSRRLGCDNYLFGGALDDDLDIPQHPETHTGYLDIAQVDGKGQSFTHPPKNDYPQNRDKLSGNLPTPDLSSIPVWFYYDQSRGETDGGGQDMSCSEDNLMYGCMKRYNPTTEGVANPTKTGDFIAFTTKKIGGLPDWVMKGINQVNTGTISLDHRNHFGIDRHFNAYGTNVIMPYSGYLTGTQPPPNEEEITATLSVPLDCYSDFYYTAFSGALAPGYQSGGSKNQTRPDVTNCMLEYTFQHSLHSYIGANGIALNYDNLIQKRFNWSGLHTPEYIGNNYNAGSDATDPKISDANNAVYKINKRLGGASFCPEMIPYATDVTTTTKDASDTDISISTSNWNLQQWDAIFDAHSGIVFDEFGGTNINRAYWHKSLWGILGFSYEQFNKEYDNQQDVVNIKDRQTFNTRLNPDNQGLSPYVMTNALVKTSDVSVYRSNIYGSSVFTQQGLSYGNNWHGGLAIKTGAKAHQVTTGEKEYLLNNPAVSLEATSVAIQANRQPTKMLKPYFLIKSNIVGDTKYIGGGNSTDGGQVLPIVGVVNKENGFGDFYFQTTQQGTFTITDDVTISDITTSIHDPDMTLARVDKNSAVLYLIQKQNNNNLNVMQTLVQNEEINPVDLMPPAFTAEEMKQYFDTIVANKEEIRAEVKNNIEAHYQTTGGEPPQSYDFDFQGFNVPGISLVGGQPPPSPENVGIGSLIPKRGTPSQRMLGQRGGDEPERIMGAPRYAGAPDPYFSNPAKAITRSGMRKVEGLRGMQERARAMLYRNFIASGDAPAEQSADMPAWYRDVLRQSPGLARTLSLALSEASSQGSSTAPPASAVASSVSDPTSVRSIPSTDGEPVKPADKP